MYSGFYNSSFSSAFDTNDVTINNLPAGTVNKHSHVLVTISEVSSQPAGQLDIPVLGGATLTIHNVCPQDNNTIIVRLSNTWNGFLEYRIWVTVL